MRVLVACEFSGRVRNAFQKLGHDAWSCDVKEAPGNHFTCDARTILNKGWDLLIAHPPCTYLCGSGVRWLYANNNKFRAVKREKAAMFFMEFMRCSISKICVENPVGYMNTKYRKPDQIIQPWHFGVPETKTTCLWLKGLPRLQWKNPVEIMPDTQIERQKMFYLRPSEQRSDICSTTYTEIASAMAEQWGCL